VSLIRLNNVPASSEHHFEPSEGRTEADANAKRGEEEEEEEEEEASHSRLLALSRRAPVPYNIPHISARIQPDEASQLGEREPIIPRESALFARIHPRTASSMSPGVT